jgi:uncharacterized membrane protein
MQGSGSRPKAGPWWLGRGFPLLHAIFEIGIILKGVNAFVELVSGAILLAFSVERLRAIVDAVAGGGNAWFRRYWAMIFYRLSQWIAPDTKAFFTWFFLSHGAVKAFIILCLFRGWIWAYPLGIGVFLAFIVYQVAEIVAGQHSTLYTVLTILDALVIALTVNEWRHAKALGKSRAGSA